MSRRAIAIAACLAAVSSMATNAVAHEFRPSILDITDQGGGRYEVIWTAPSSGGEDASEATPIFPGSCHRDSNSGSRFVLDCGPGGLAGRSITIRRLTHGDALVRFTSPAATTTAVLREGNPSFTIPAPAGEPTTSRLERARGYFRAGVAHILHGVDHLLFVLGLLLLVRGGAALVRTVTAFTLAHSTTLALAVTAAVRLPPAPVEAAIALSLVLLAAEIVRPPNDSPPTRARRRPAVIAFVFGLLHGFGFAGGLAELRVPGTDLPLALAGFNLGVEAGQLAFVAAALASIPLLRRVIARAPRIERVPAYVIGALGAFFVFERVAAFWRS